MAGALLPDQHPESTDPEVGLPSSKKGVLRRLLVRLAWPVLSRQIDFDHRTDEGLLLWPKDSRCSALAEA